MINATFSLCRIQTGLLICALFILSFGVGHAQTVTEDFKIAASDAALPDNFGYCVSVSGDTAIVGATGNRHGGKLSGSAYIFMRNGGSWVQAAKFVANDIEEGYRVSKGLAVFDTVTQNAEAEDGFGIGVSVSGDTAIVGAPGEDDAGLNSGSAYIFTQSANGWIRQTKLKASDAEKGDAFGYSVSVSGDTAIVASVFDDDSTGSVYVFVREGVTWTQQAKLTASDVFKNDHFGFCVALSGNTAIIGTLNKTNDYVNPGSVYIFSCSDGVWAQQAKLTSSDTPTGDWFGNSVSIDGETVFVGAVRDNDGGEYSGSAYIFTRSGSVWSQQAKLIASDAAASDHFGWSVSVSGDTALIGSVFDDARELDSGSAYLFTRRDGLWKQGAKLTASDAAMGDSFGKSVSISGKNAIVGANFSDSAGTDSGSAYIFDLTKPSTSPVGKNSPE